MDFRHLFGVLHRQRCHFAPRKTNKLRRSLKPPRASMYQLHTSMKHADDIADDEQYCNFHVWFGGQDAAGSSTTMALYLSML